MNSKFKRRLIEYGIMGAVILTLYFAGLHTEVLGFIQRGALLAGLRDAQIEETTNDSTKANPPADFSIRLINSEGEKVNMNDFRGNVIFMNFWATWCPPCIAEMPGIHDLYREIKSEEVVFLMISLDDDFEKAKRFKEKKGFDFRDFSIRGEVT